MKGNIVRKGLVLGIILLFVGAGIIPSTVSIIEKRTTFANSISPGYIQDLIDNASNGDTIFIPSGTYYENIIINKSISLVGEDKNTTVIDGSNNGNVVNVTADWVNISGFTIRNSSGGEYYGGICLKANYTTISDNIIMNNQKHGIFIDLMLYVWVGNNIIANNSILQNEIGITYFGFDSAIIHNTISNNIEGLSIVFCVNVTIADNIISDNIDTGIDIVYEDYYNKVYNNTISDSNFGLTICWPGFIGSPRNNIIENNSFFNTGIYTSPGTNNIIRNNSVNGKPLIFLAGVNDMVIDNAGQIMLSCCTNITIENQELCNSTVGVFIECTQNCHLVNNLISSNKMMGLIIEDFTNNTIRGNIITNNKGDGLLLYSGFNNNITGNTINTNKGNGISLNPYYGYINDNIITGNNINLNNGCGIDFNHCSNITVSDNDISNNLILGLRLSHSFDNYLINNVITSNYEEGILLIDSSNNSILGNNISENEDGIELEDSSDNIISENIISSNNDYGVEFIGSSKDLCINNSITHNTIKLNNQGIYLENSSKNNIQKNNFQRNTRYAFFINCTNTWNKNYWNRPRILPKLIFGKIKIGSIGIPWINIDWRPAQQPYDIGGV